MQETSFKTKDAERREYKQKHGIMTQEERDAIMKANAGKAKSDGGN